MAVTPEVQSILDALAALDGPPIEEQTPEQLRQAYAQMNRLASKVEMASVTDRMFPGPAGDVPVRVYVPTAEPGPRPVIVYFHGGGWVIGDLETHDATVRSLAAASGVTVVSVDYRLAPEHRFPAAVDDCLAAVRWVASPDGAAALGVDPVRLAVGGDSAGGNLAAVVAQHVRDTGPALRFQLLVYPATDAQLAHPSIDENADGFFLTKADIVWFRRHYLGNDWARSATDPRVSPLLAEDEAVRGVAPALVITAEYDPLRDEGEAYAAKLRGAGVEATASRYDCMIHGFFSMGDLVPEGKAAIDEAAEALRAALA
ncbi:MAG TPA: alpha/beta hydrolase [Acidimicrobiales bacterium]|nr:alpha/beta hydrolase [Acidimicrobiales bacterium]